MRTTSLFVGSLFPISIRGLGLLDVIISTYLRLLQMKRCLDLLQIMTYRSKASRNTSATSCNPGLLPTDVYGIPYYRQCIFRDNTRQQFPKQPETFSMPLTVLNVLVRMHVRVGCCLHKLGGCVTPYLYPLHGTMSSNSPILMARNRSKSISLRLCIWYGFFFQAHAAGYLLCT